MTKLFRELVSQNCSPERAKEIEEKVELLIKQMDFLEKEDLFEKIKEVTDKLPEHIRETAYRFLFPFLVSKIMEISNSKLLKK